MTILRRAVVDAGGAAAVAKACGVSVRAVYKWLSAGRLPRTEWTGETQYAEKIAAAAGGAFSAKELLGTLKVQQGRAS